jgi:hypothetical protein
VHAGQESLDDALRDDFDPPEARNVCGVEEI